MYIFKKKRKRHKHSKQGALVFINSIQHIYFPREAASIITRLNFTILNRSYFINSNLKIGYPGFDNVN